MRIKALLGENKLLFQCPGCNQEHAINTSWQYNQDSENPTINPSILVQGGRHKENTPPYNTEMFVCHSFIKDGNIQFLGDCTHALANQTVPLPHYETQN